MIVYRNMVSGHEVSHFSPSQSSSLGHCAAKYGLERVVGWTNWPPKAHPEMGKSLELAVRTWREVPGTSLAQTFTEDWSKHREGTELEYKPGHTWEKLHEAGLEVLRVLRASWARLGINEPVFYTYDRGIDDVELVEGISFKTIPDCIDWPEPHPKWGSGRRVIDIKTSDTPFRQEPEGIAAMDEQLRSYALRCEAWRVAFLVLVWKTGRPKSGDWVTLCEPIGNISPGAILKVEDSVKADAVSAQCKFGPTSFPVPIAHLSKARVQFIEARVTPEQCMQTMRVHRERALEAAARYRRFEELMAPLATAKDLMTAAEWDEAVFNNLLEAYPQSPGMRFPNDKCGWCDMAGLCLHNKGLVEGKIVRRGEIWTEKL